MVLQHFGGKKCETAFFFLFFFFGGGGGGGGGTTKNFYCACDLDNICIRKTTKPLEFLRTGSFYKTLKIDIFVKLNCVFVVFLIFL